MAAELQPFTLLPWQDALWQRLQDSRAQQRLPHAVLLSGPSGVGKRLFAQRLAAALVCEDTQIQRQPCGQCKACRLIAASTHPDVHWLEPEEEGKNIRIDAVRALTARTTLTTQARGSRVFLISPAHAMNRAASNALLKTLEEPTASSVLVLISSQPHLLPATVRSRCQDIVFKPVDAAQAEQWLLGKVDKTELLPLLALTGGAPLAALKAAEEGWLSAAEDTVARLTELKLRKTNPMQVVEHWGQRALDGLLVDLARVCSDLVQLSSAQQSPRLFMPQARDNLQVLANGIDLQRLFNFTDELNRLKRQMNHNLNPQMLLEKIVTDWLALTRPQVRR